MKKTELLSPAGNIDAVYQAVHNGADAIYIGGKSFGARAFAHNFSYDEIEKAIDYAHTYGVKIYVTVNTLIYENETSDFLEHIKNIYARGADALIIQDIGMAALVGRRFPDIAIHASTQMHNHSDACLKFAEELGATRAILARETDLEQIKNFTSGIEKEVFIHGALCISYSGQCLMSAMTQKRSGNRGTCAQSCRMRYNLVDSTELKVNRVGHYMLSPKDIALFEDIQALLDAGVGCFKIEGRMKPPEYVGLVTKIYADLLEKHRHHQPMKANEDNIEKLKKLFNRGFTKGHLIKAQDDALMSILRPNHKGVAVGSVISVGDRIKLKLCAPLNQGDGIKFEKNDDGFICNKIYKSGKLVSGAGTGDIVALERKAKTVAGDSVVKTNDARLLKELQNFTEKKVIISGHVTARRGGPLCIQLCDADGHSVSVYGEAVQPSRTRPSTKEEIITGVKKLGDTAYHMNEIEVDYDDDIFIAKSALNALRRNAVQSLTAARTHVAERRMNDFIPAAVRHSEDLNRAQLHVLVRSRAQFEVVRDRITGDIYTDDARLYFENKNACPGLRLKTDRMAKEPAPYHDERLLVTDNGGVFQYRNDNDIVLDYTMNVLNSYTLSYFAGMNARRIALSPELDIQQTAAMIDAYEAANGQMPAVEAIVYARHELMAMRHCVIRHALGLKQNCGRCNKEQYYLEDMGGRRFPVVTDTNCHNYVLNSAVVKADIPSLQAQGVRHYRIEFFDESPQEITDMINSMSRQIGL